MGIFSIFLQSKHKIANEPLKTGSYIGKVVDVGLELKGKSSTPYSDMLNFAIAVKDDTDTAIHIIRTFRNSCQIKQLYDIASDFAAVLNCTPEAVTAGILRNKFFLFHIEECRAKNGSTFNKIEKILCADTQNPDYKALQTENFSFSFSHELSCSPEMPIVDIAPDGEYMAMITSSEIRQTSNLASVLLNLRVYNEFQETTDIAVWLNSSYQLDVIEYLDGLAQNEDDLRGLVFIVDLSLNDGYYAIDYIRLADEDAFDEQEECGWEV